MDDGGTHGRMVERSLVENTMCSSKGKTNAGFTYFQGPLNIEVKTVVSNLLNTDLVIIPGGMTSRLQVLDVAANNHAKINYVACMRNGRNLGNGHQHQQKK
jgi:hypothetical protein